MMNYTTSSLAVILFAAGVVQPLAAQEQTGQTNPIAIAPPDTVEEVVVLGKYVPDEKRDTSEISNMLDTEALNLLSDSSVGEALSRVTGLSLVGGKYVYVRGLGERYSSTLLNGSRISSPVPFQKTVPLDIVPKNLIRDLLVQKTYSAQYPGDFSGGLVDMRTKATPDEDYFTLQVSGGGNSESTGGDGLNYKGGRDDQWGYDDGTRGIPRNVRQLSSEEFDRVPFPERQGLGASFYNYWNVRENDKVDPDYGIEGELGRHFELNNGWILGMLISGKYGNEWRNRDKDLRRYEFSGVPGDTGTQTVDYNQFTTRNEIEFSGFGTIGLEFDENNSIALTSLALRLTTDETQLSKGISSEDNVALGTPVRNVLFQWIENEIISNSVTGEHFIPRWNDASVSWRYVDGRASRDSPDTRSYTYAENRDGLFEMVTSGRQAAGDLRETNQAPQRSYSRLADDIEQYGLDLDLPFLLDDVALDVKTGYSHYERTRKTKDRLFRFDLTSRAADYVGLELPSQFFDIPNWASGALSVRDFSAAAANASGIFPFAESGEKDNAYYLAFDAQLTERLRVQAGARKEQTKLNADAWGGNIEPGTENQVKQQFTDTLPSASVTWEFIPDMQVRAAYSKTVNRPSLTEITGNTIRNPDDDRFYRGNVFLSQADVTNYDLRWEWYFGAADSMSLGLFRKDIDNPIELGKVQAQGDIYTWFNADEAWLQGAEYEIVKDLPFATWFGWSDYWDYFRVSANVTYIDSQVTLLGSGETAEDVPLTGGRRLQPFYSNKRKITGQSDWLGNLILSYVNVDKGIEGSLTYNYTDDRIVLVGERNNPNIIEDARGKLDLLAKYLFQAWGADMEVEFKVTNILNEEVKWTQGGNLYEEYDQGISYELSLQVTLY